jgi:hypothetical protein
MTTPAGGPPRRPLNVGVLAGAGGVVLVVVIGAVVVGRSGGSDGSGGSLLPWVLVPLLLIGGLVAETYATRRRHERNRAWAVAQGWSYQGADATLVHRWSGEPFGEGRSRTATEVLRGVFRGHPVTSFTYRWTTGSGKNRTTHTRHVVAAIARVLGGQDIRFEHEEFNAEWRVQAADLRFAHGVVHPRLMEALMRRPARGTSLRVGGPSILCWAYGRTDLDQVLARASVLCTVVDAIPRHVWQDHGWDPEAPVAR